jgi:thiamine-monophosphate kinase
MAGEFEFIDWLRLRQRPSALVPVPAGDDLAVLKWPGDELLLVGVDQVLDGVHFDSAVHSPRAIGAKAMNRNLSDCAAMACLPAAAVVSAALPRGADLEYAKELYLGMESAAAAFGCAIVGGDTGSWAGKLAVTVTIMGRSAGIEPVRRAGARPGQLIGVTGPLGGSIRGRHMTFTPRVTEARELAKRLRVTAMIDLSDGVSRDLGHVCRASGVGAVVWADRVPVHQDAIEVRRAGRSPLEHALHDGEDYELLCVVDAGSGFGERETVAELAGRPPEVGMAEVAGLTIIGVTTAEAGVWLATGRGVGPLEPMGWEHEL